VWRVILAKVATLQEIETHWSLNDLFDALEILDITERAEREMHQEKSKGQK